MKSEWQIFLEEFAQAAAVHPRTGPIIAASRNVIQNAVQEMSHTKREAAEVIQTAQERYRIVAGSISAIIRAAKAR